MLNKARVAFLSLLILSSITGCGGGGNGATPAPEAPQAEAAGSVLASGSTAMQPLVEQAADEFMAQNPDVTIQVQGGGSGTGLSQVAEGTVQIGNSDIFAEEKEGIDATQLVDHKVAVAGMAATAHSEVGVDNLTTQQLIDIFTGKITNWKDVGGADVQVTLVNRPKSSGTRATFIKYALNGQEEAEGVTQDSSGTVRKIISETPGAIGYLGFNYIDQSIKPLSIDGVAPTSENVATNEYKVWAYEHMYTKGEPTGVVKSFLDYMLSDEAQLIVEELGYIPVKNMKVDRDFQGNVK
ncbi:phosphate ABC transporter substrate-binding protein [Ammoniphilus sp. CFH 90114]|uniref:phosphate ABC transporter substrate-binding protein n=1 Tax=Ammoniphilus sp. CFH 90114 TaxID=2493665 RepID=UPI0013E9598D|nr:phosphate ABC transporter substrate-binding protein [Ammoniphilus sp. CFH 90114]